MDLKIIATLVVLALSVVLTWIGRRLGQNSPGLDNGLLAIGLLLAMWIPQGARDFALIAVAGLIGLLGGRALAIAAIGLTAGLAVAVPGGAMVVLLGLCAILAYVSARQERGRLVSLVKAALLVPGEDKQIEVAVIGPASARGVQRPDTGEPVVAWWAEIHEIPANADELRHRLGEPAARFASDTPVVIDTESGNALADLESFEPRASGLPIQVLAGEPAIELAGKLGHTPESEVKVTIWWIDRDASLYVKGVPVWEADPGGGGGYRDSAFVPVFRPSESNPLQLKLGTLEQLKNNITYGIVMWGAWAIPCAGIAAVQIATSL